MTLDGKQQTLETNMFAEARDAAHIVREQRHANAPLIASLAKRLRARPPRSVVTIARGSSDHAATYGKYLIETATRIITSSASPSVQSVYDQTPYADGTLCLAISQSGQSPDIVAAAQAAKSGGAFLVALLNQPDSPLARIADQVLPLGAGPEKSVAATKSYIASLVAIADLVAAWTDDTTLMAALDALPEHLHAAWELDWSPIADALIDTRNMFVLGRGHGLGVAQEAALKFKETSRIHAEAFSFAEVLHGPAALFEPGFPVLAFLQRDRTLAHSREILQAMVDKGVHVFSVGQSGPGLVPLPTIETDPRLEPIVQSMSFYRMANGLAIRRQLDPDAPPHLSKVTETV